ncbi:MAG: M48 family metalloprotease [Candidatus Aminicenantes bacterium]|nr:M48 family metalloprotease [Candidatus Aminicenantes bacterium]
MMYTNFFLFIVAATVFASAPEGPVPPLDRVWALAITLLLMAGFWQWNRLRFFQLEKRCRHQGTDPGNMRRKYQRAVGVHSMLAVGVFVLAVTGFSVKPMIRQLPLVGNSVFLTHALGLILFLFFLVAVWFWSWRAFNGMMSTAPTARAHVVSQLRFNLVIVIPWLLLSLAVDFWSLLPLPAASMESATVQLIFFGLFVLLLALFVPVLMTRLWDCGSLDDGAMESRIESFARQLGVRFRRILSWNAMHRGLVTAGVVGFVPGLRYLLITPALSRLLSEDEILAVVGHEVGHVRRRHMWLYMLFFAGFVVISLGLVDRFVSWLAGTGPGLSLLVRADGRLNTAFLGWASAAVSLLLFVMYFRYVFGWFMRNFERQADQFCFVAGVPVEHLISAFDKLRNHSGGGDEQGNWHHYSISQRIQWLQRCAGDPTLTAYHDRLVRRGLIAFVLALTVFAGFAFRSGSDAGAVVSIRRLDRVVTQRLTNHPRNPALWSLLGNLKVEGKQWREAEAAFRRSLELQYNQPDTLNNYAWVLLTCPEEPLRDPRLALRLALDAVSMRRTHYILDTLAEALLANGRVDEAVEAAREALSLASENLDYYRRQLTRMQRAALARGAERM